MAIDSWNNGNNLTHRNQAIDSMAHVNWHQCIYKSRAVVVTATCLMNEWCVGEWVRLWCYQRQSQSASLVISELLCVLNKPECFQLCIIDVTLEWLWHLEAIPARQKHWRMPFSKFNLWAVSLQSGSCSLDMYFMYSRLSDICILFKSCDVMIA